VTTYSPSNASASWWSITSSTTRTASVINSGENRIDIEATTAGAASERLVIHVTADAGI
jgi:hypothetical protein